MTAKDFGGAVLATATTTSLGGYSLANVPVGTVQVTFTKTYYTSPAAITVGTIAGGSVTSAFGDCSAHWKPALERLTTRRRVAEL